MSDARDRGGPPQTKTLAEGWEEILAGSQPEETKRPVAEPAGGGHGPRPGDDSASAATASRGADEMERLMTGPFSTAPKPVDEAPAVDEAPGGDEASGETSPNLEPAGVEGGGSGDVPSEGQAGQHQEEQTVRGNGSAEEGPSPSPAASDDGGEVGTARSAASGEPGGFRWLAVVGAVAVFGIAVAAMGGPASEPDASAPPRQRQAGSPAKQLSAPAPARSWEPPSAGASQGPIPVNSDPKGSPSQPEGPSSKAVRADPRRPPAGTPAEIAAVFKKIPVSPADRAPVGGVGKTGVHVDDIAMGTGYARSRCTGVVESFSVNNDKQANVCVRVVHQRQKENLTVVWQKHAGNARRGKVVVKAAHAYRTRAYLKLRKEYVGDWTVRLVSADGVELAAHDFSIVP